MATSDRTRTWVTRSNGAIARSNGVVASPRAMRSTLCEGLILGPCRQIDGRDAQPDVWLYDLKRLSINLGERGSQRFLPLYNLNKGLFDQFRRQVALDSPPHRNVQRGIAGFQLVQHPEALLRQGGGILDGALRV